MKKFPNKEQMTYAECLGPAMEITDQKDADQYLEAYIQWTIGKGKTRAESERIVKANLGYYSGYYSEATRKKVERLFRCAHPIFGSLEENGRPTGEEAYKCGLENKTLREIRGRH